MPQQPSARERLLDAAEDLAATNGVAATPVDVILARAQVSPATLYAHFGNKEGLIAEALQRRLARWDAVWQDCIDAAEDPEERVLALFDALARYRDARGPSRWCAFLGVAAETAEPRPGLDGILEQDTDLLLTRLRELVRPAVGEATSEVAARRTLLVYTGVLGMILRGADAGVAAADGREAARATLRALVEPVGV